MKKILLTLSLVLLLFSNCDKLNPTPTGTVRYEVECTDLGFQVGYLDKNISKDALQYARIEDYSWKYSFKGSPGDVVYIAAISNVNASILVRLYYRDEFIMEQHSSGDRPDLGARIRYTLN